MLKAIEDDLNEQERRRAADMMARHFVDQHWPDIEATILPPVEGCSNWDIVRHKSKVRGLWLDLMQKFWGEQV